MIHPTTLKIRMNENYGLILKDMTVEETVWAELYEEFEYLIERGREDLALLTLTALKKDPPTKDQTKAVTDSAATKLRCNPLYTESERLREDKRRLSDRNAPTTMYDPTDFTDQILDTNGKEKATSFSPEDAYVEAIDAAQRDKGSISALLIFGQVWTKPRGRGRPRKTPELLEAIEEFTTTNINLELGL